MHSFSSIGLGVLSDVQPSGQLNRQGFSASHAKTQSRAFGVAFLFRSVTSNHLEANSGVVGCRSENNAPLEIAWSRLEKLFRWVVEMLG